MGGRERLGVAVCIAAILCSCGERDAPANEASSPVGTAVPEFTLDSASRFREFKVPDHALPGVIIAGYDGVLLSSHLAAVANFDHVLLYDALADSGYRIGRKGVGPGEFQRLSNVFDAGDGFATADNMQHQFNLFSSSGEFVRAVPVGQGNAIGWLEGVGPVTRRGGFETPPIYRSHDSAGRVIREILTQQAPPILFARIIDEDGSSGYHFLSPACDPSLLAATVGQTLYVADQTAGQILAVNPGGTSRIVFESPRKGRVTDEMIRKVKTNFSRARPAELNRVLGVFGGRGDSLHITWDRMIPDATGRIWLRFSECINQGDRVWDLIDTAGVRRGALRTNLHIIAAYDRSVLVRGEDSIGTPELTIWKLVPR
jgi:hypothetical protein